MTPAPLEALRQAIKNYRDAADSPSDDSEHAAATELADAAEAIEQWLTSPPAPTVTEVDDEETRPIEVEWTELCRYRRTIDAPLDLDPADHDAVEALICGKDNTDHCVGADYTIKSAELANA